MAAGSWVLWGLDEADLALRKIGGSIWKTNKNPNRSVQFYEKWPKNKSNINKQAPYDDSYYFSN